MINKSPINFYCGLFILYLDNVMKIIFKNIFLFLLAFFAFCFLLICLSPTYRNKIYDEFKRGNIRFPPLQRKLPLFEYFLSFPRSSWKQEVVLEQWEWISILDEGIYQKERLGFSILNISGTGGLDISYFFLYPWSKYSKQYLVDERSFKFLYIEPSESRCIRVMYWYMSKPNECTALIINPKDISMESDNNILVSIRNHWWIERTSFVLTYD